ncbi:nuclear ribonuclease Z [Thraustotheca clavata]|uniref:Nuclear ribonuclease Z n=1 Tax=Thraustotheca clavata TaxID=74557 RepID=A0A1V9ZQP9_9STRA|nr:nuclear ribonuclease Z [Thraustotheca clavata]
MRSAKATSTSVRKQWFDQATLALVTNAQERAMKAKTKKQGAKDLAREARQRSSQLSTSSDTVGVSFAGAAFQADYFSSKFAKRGMLVYSIIQDLLSKSSSLINGSDEITVASFGGGPGTDAAGIVWIQKEFFPNCTVECTLFDYETSWKRYVKTLDSLFGDAVNVNFRPCDVTQPVNSDANRHVCEVDTMDILLFCYVCHETSSRQTTLQFYTDIALNAKSGAFVILADVKTTSKRCLEEVATTMIQARRIERLNLSKPPNAEVICDIDMVHLETLPQVSINAIAGIASCCYVQSMDVAFDMGITFGKAVGQKHVFITHGHIDHIKALPGHVGERALNKMAPATYYVPKHLTENIKQILAAYESMTEAALPANIVGVEAGMSFRISSTVLVKAFATVHRVPSLGYVAYRVSRQLKPEYVGLDREELIALRKAKVLIENEVLIPEVAYTGDTQIDFFDSSNEENNADFLRANDKTSPAKATERGHIHVQQLLAMQYRFENQHVVLTHFSARYSLPVLEKLLTFDPSIQPQLWIAHGQFSTSLYCSRD